MNHTGALRKLLAAFDAHETMLIAYRTGGHTPGKAIDTIARVKTVLPQIRELIDRLPDIDPHTETPAQVLWEGETSADSALGPNRSFLSGRLGAVDCPPGTRVRVVRADTPHHKATQ